MNQSRLLERNILSDLITDNSKGPIARSCYLYYREPFLRIFSDIEGIGKAKAIHLYANTFPAFCIELEDNRGNKLGDGTLFSGLLLLGSTLLKKDHPNFDPQSITTNHAYIDSDLLLHLLKNQDTFVLEVVKENFRKPAGLIFCSLRKLDTFNEPFFKEILEPFGEAFSLFHKKIREEAVKAPMKATLFTYFYRFFENKAKEYHRKKKKHWGSVTPEENIEFFSEPEEPSHTYFDHLRDKLGPRLDTAENEKEFVLQLIAKLDEICRQLILGYYLEGTPLNELGQTLNLPNPKKRIHDCRQKIRKMIT